MAGLHRFARPVLVTGVPGGVVAPKGKVLSVVAFTVAGGRSMCWSIRSAPIGSTSRCSTTEARIVAST
jgi:hypothetical protein